MAFAPFVTTYTPEPTRPASGPQPGALSLMDWVIAEWDDADAHDDADPHNLGIFVPRDICHNLWPHWSCIGSQHARGAALDVGFPDVGEGGHPEGWKYAHWLVANHAVLGVQEGIYARRRWTNQTLRWSDYHGPSPHLDHVHAALNASGARYLTRARIESVAPRPPAPTPAPPVAAAYQEDQAMFFQAPGGSYIMLNDGKLTQISHQDATTAEAKLLKDLLLQVPEECRHITKVGAAYWKVLTTAYTLVKLD